jgi:hypothetical protein
MTHKRSLVQIQYGPLLDHIEPCFTAGFDFLCTRSFCGLAGRSGNAAFATGGSAGSIDRLASVDSPRSRRRVITIKASSRLHGGKRHARFATTAPRSSVRSGFLRSNPRFEAVLLRRWQRCQRRPSARPGSSTPFANIADVSGVSMASVGVRSTTFRWLEFVDSTPELTC